MTYIMSDIHGQFDEFKIMLQKIKFTHSDTLYIIGDVLDCGEKPIELLRYIMSKNNIFLLLGNHELYAILLLPIFTKKVAKTNYNILISKTKEKLFYEWSSNGGYTTIYEFKKLLFKNKILIIDYLKKLKFCQKLTINNQNFVIAHSFFSALKKSSNYSIEEVLHTFERIDYEKVYFEDCIFISGHTPTYIVEKSTYGKIFANNYNININCGMNVLACLRLEDFNEFYV